MPDIQEIIRLMKDLEDQLVSCMRCGMCQAVCPLYAQTGREADVARGKLALLDGLLKEMLDNPAEVSERLNKCLLCGSCAANCPSGVHVLEIFLKARAILTGALGLSPAKRLVLKRLLARPRLLDRTAEWAARFQGIFTRPVNETVGTSCARFASPLLSGRHFRTLAADPFHRDTPAMDTEPSGSGGKVAFFVGCLIDKIFPDVAKAVVEVLQYHDAGILIPEGQGCCGIPALSAGETETFKQLLAHNLKLLENRSFDTLVTACATCTATIKELWPVMAADTAPHLQAAAAQISEKTMDIHQYLVRRAGLKRLPEGSREPVHTVTYHDPCHLKKSLKVVDEPRQVLRAAGNGRLVEMPNGDACCGMGGSFNLLYYDISAGIGRLKRDSIVATGCSVVATGCPACMMQISDVLSRNGDHIAVRHPVQIYAEAMKNHESATQTG